MRGYTTRLRQRIDVLIFLIPRRLLWRVATNSRLMTLVGASSNNLNFAKMEHARLSDAVVESLIERVLCDGDVNNNSHTRRRLLDLAAIAMWQLLHL